MKIAFGCQARVGKDTACDYLWERYGGRVLRFAEPLYKILYFAQETCGLPKQKDTKFLQWIGTEWGRAQKESLWVDLLLQNTCQYPNENYFVADLRFPNELQALKAAGFKCVRIVRGCRPTDRDNTHPSETALLDSDQWDYVIENNGTLLEFYQKLEEYCKRFKNGTEESNEHK